MRFQREKEEKKLMRKMGMRLGRILSALLAGVRAEAVALCGFNCCGMESDAQSIFFLSEKHVSKQPATYIPGNLAYL